MKSINKPKLKQQYDKISEETHRNAELVVKKLLDTPHKTHKQITEKRKRIAMR